MSKKEEFILRAKQVHGDYYLYKEVDLTDETGLVEVVVTCPSHGNYVVLPFRHLEGMGCPICDRKSATSSLSQRTKPGKGNRFDESKSSAPSQTAQSGQHKTPAVRSVTFIQKAKDIHGPRYRYDKAEYVNSRTKIIITCDEHGDFEQLPASHLRGAGCPTCSGNKKLTAQEFIQRARNIHGDRYRYDKSQYVSAATKIIVTCDEHGDFEQLPASHLRGAGCRSCAGKIASKDNNLLVLYPALAAQWHPTKNGDLKPDAVMVGSNKKVWWQCSRNDKHVWEASPASRNKRSDCRYCAGRKYSTETFIQKAKQVHKDRYGYEKVEYVNSRTKVIIKCREHGEFEQTASRHLLGEGCRMCGSRVAGPGNSLRTKFPEIADEWHPTKNGNLTPSNVTYGSAKKVWWQCQEQGHVWQGSVNGRTNPTSSFCCPVCSRDPIFRLTSHPENTLRFVGKSEDKLSRIWHCENCDNRITIPANQSFSPQELRCKACFQAKLKKEAETAGLTLLNKDAKNSQYRFYRFNDCGHEQELVTRNVRRLWGLNCRQCIDVLVKKEAEAAGLTLVRYMTENDTESHQYGLYRYKSCGHSSQITRDQIRRGRVPPCRHCNSA